MHDGARELRLRELDSIRGIAAALVLLGHAAGLVPPVAPWNWMLRPPLRYLLLGRAPVIVFFVLSGFVLTISLTQAVPPTFGQFVIRRFCRIYVPFAASIILSVALYYSIHPSLVGDQSDWFNGTWGNEVTVPVVIGHLLMLGRFEDGALNNVVWSLWFELRISFLLPLLIAVTRLIGPIPAIAAFALFAAVVEASMLAVGIDERPYYAYNIIEAVLTTAHLVPLFVAGMLAALYSNRIIDSVSTITGYERAALWFVAIMLLGRYRDYVVGFGAVIIICLAISAKRSGWLLFPPFQWLGRVSFSLYLVHVPILIALYHALYNHVGGGWIAMIGISTSLLAAEFGYRVVELPSIRLGRLLTARTQHRRSERKRNL